MHKFKQINSVVTTDVIGVYTTAEENNNNCDSLRTNFDALLW